jgi:hypothetical protein
MTCCTASSLCRAGTRSVAPWGHTPLTVMSASCTGGHEAEDCSNPCDTSAI